METKKAKEIEMITPKMSSLERQVFGTNKINAYTIEHVKKILPQLSKHLNTKIELATGGHAAKFKVELMEVPYIPELGQSFRAYLSIEYGELKLINDITLADKQYEGGGHGVTYYKQRVTLGKVENGVLTEIYKLKNIISSNGLKKVYNWKKIAAMKKEIERLDDRKRKLEWEVKRATGN